MSDDDAPIVASVPAFAWDSRESVAYEAALEAVNAAVGAYTARIAVEEARAAPDRDVIAALQAHQHRCVRAGEQLDPTDRAAIADARRRYAELAQAVREGHP